MRALKTALKASKKASKKANSLARSLGGGGDDWPCSVVVRPLWPLPLFVHQSFPWRKQLSEFAQNRWNCKRSLYVRVCVCLQDAKGLFCGDVGAFNAYLCTRASFHLRLIGVLRSAVFEAQGSQDYIISYHII